jgi:hypothetical protein
MNRTNNTPQENAQEVILKFLEKTKDGEYIEIDKDMIEIPRMFVEDTNEEIYSYGLN